MVRFAILVCLLFAAVAARRTWHPMKSPEPIQRGDLPPWMNYTQNQFSFTQQKLDHFDLSNQNTWTQRYWVVNDFWSAPNGPIFLYICGEYTCPGVNPERLFVTELAYQYGAAIYVLEHRFYGQSYPLPDQSVQNLKYLASSQALADLAYFQNWVQNSINAQYGTTTKNKWISIGGSYPGALSAWYRLKYPHMVEGALASSGVVNAIVDFYQFDQQISRAAGPACTMALQQTTQAIEAALPGVKALFGTDSNALTDDDFLYMIADVMAESVQYGHRLMLCQAVQAGSNWVNQFANFTVSYYFNQLGNSATDYNSYLISNIHNGDGRSWWWQTCVEFGWFQTAPAQNSVRSKRVNMNYFKNVCRIIFGNGIPALPDANATNVIYGGDKIAASNIFFTNGVEDPWQWASVRADISSSEPAKISNCVQCAHCAELYTPTSSDDPDLNLTREMSMMYVNEWLTSSTA